MRGSQSADLSREISGVVSRILAGATVDRHDCGRALAERYPETGMSAELIAKAIERSLSMLGDIRSAHANGHGHANGNAAEAAPVDSPAADDEPAAALAQADTAELDSTAAAPASPPADVVAAPPPAGGTFAGIRAPAVRKPRRPFEQPLVSLRRLAARLSRNTGIERGETI